MRTRPLPLLTLLLVLVAPAAASARTHVAIGLGDQSPKMFSSARYTSLHLKKARYNIRWDAIAHPYELGQADAYVKAARKAHVRVLMHIATNDYTPKQAKLPKASTYRLYVGRLVKRFRPQGVLDWGVWNEANHVSEPTYRSPARAAAYFHEMRRICKGCHIVALDILDQAGAERYVDRFMRAAGAQRRYVHYVGLHNYSDTNRLRTTGTSQFVRTVHRWRRATKVWMTETGGVVEFGRSFPCNASRAANRIGYMFSIARHFRGSISRVYAYNWFGTNCASRFDAGLVSANGSPRPGFYAFRRHLAGFDR